MNSIWLTKLNFLIMLQNSRDIDVLQDNNKLCIIQDIEYGLKIEHMNVFNMCIVHIRLF